MVEGGLGLMSRLYTSPDRSSVLHLRAEAKGRWHVSWLTDPHQGEPADFLAGLGFQFNWGAPAPVAAAPVAAAPVDVDSDGDGVVDRLDQCPGTPAGAKVDANGCELDSDGDGVVDRLDRCPGTPAGAKVDANGCELDSDGDGVVDRLDQCPGTPHGTKVDARGCEIEAIVLRGVNFDFDSSHLTTASEKVLDEVVALLKLRAGSMAVIGGHTDGRGKKAYNQKLSERRATAVVDYLVAHGVPAASLRAKGYGATQPIASNDTEDGRAQNRRVTLEFTTNVTK
jgi:OOP family OmpA-OmpF porin